MARNGSQPLGRLRLYRSYSFRDKDPVIDRVRTIVQRERLGNRDVARLSGVSATTLRNWFEGETKRPQFATIAAVVGALGYRQKFVRTRRLDFAKEIERAKAEIAAATAKRE